MGQIDKKTLEEKMIERNKKIVNNFAEVSLFNLLKKFNLISTIFTKQFLKPKKIDFEPRLKMKGKSKTGRKEARKKAVKSANLKVIIKKYIEIYSKFWN